MTHQLMTHNTMTNHFRMRVNWKIHYEIRNHLAVARVVQNSSPFSRESRDSLFYEIFVEIVLKIVKKFTRGDGNYEKFKFASRKCGNGRPNHRK